MQYKIILGYIATIISVISYVPYFKSIYLGRTKPHAFSWFIWSLLTAIAFFAQVSQQGGAGAWVTASTALACFAVFFWALIKGSHEFTTFDWWALAGAIIALMLWKFTKYPTLSVILVTVVDALGFLPTFRKGYGRPNEEEISLYSCSTIKYIIGIFALEIFSLSTWLFPASLVLTNGLFVVMILWRRHQLKTI